MNAKKRVDKLEIAEYRRINPEFFEIVLKSNEKLPEMFPGQFVEVLIEGNPAAFLRRPLSIHNVNYNNDTINLLIQIVGEGTRSLSKLKIGDSVNMILPLGNSYKLVDSGNVLLVGGGCGVAPLLFLAKEFAAKGISPHILIGARNKDYLLQVNEYKKYGSVYITTEDGSEGEKGFVIHHSILWDEKNIFNKIYTCGPEAMMKAVSKYAKRRNIECEVSLENLMACGIGACLCCVVETREGHICTCTEGPVFNINDLTW